MDRHRCLEVLQLPEDATLEDIKKSYKRLALQYHPDKNHGDEKATAKFQELGEAYSYLTKDEDEDEDIYYPSYDFFDDLFFHVLSDFYFQRQFRAHYEYFTYHGEEEEEDDFYNFLYSKRRKEGADDIKLTEEDLQKFHSFEEWSQARDPKKRNNARTRRAKKKANEQSLEKPKKLTKKQMKAEQYRRQKEASAIGEQIKAVQVSAPPTANTSHQDKVNPPTSQDPQHHRSKQSPSHSEASEPPEPQPDRAPHSDMFITKATNKKKSKKARRKEKAQQSNIPGYAPVISPNKPSSPFTEEDWTVTAPQTPVNTASAAPVNTKRPGLPTTNSFSPPSTVDWLKEKDDDNGNAYGAIIPPAAQHVIQQKQDDLTDIHSKYGGKPGKENKWSNNSKQTKSKKQQEKQQQQQVTWSSITAQSATSQPPTWPSSRSQVPEEPYWDEEETTVMGHGFHPSGQPSFQLAPAPNENMWQVRAQKMQMKQENLDQLAPASEAEEEEMLRQALELSKREAERESELRAMMAAYLPDAETFPQDMMSDQVAYGGPITSTANRPDSDGYANRSVNDEYANSSWAAVTKVKADSVRTSRAPGVLKTEQPGYRNITTATTAGAPSLSASPGSHQSALGSKQPGKNKSGQSQRDAIKHQASVQPSVPADPWNKKGGSDPWRSTNRFSSSNSTELGSDLLKEISELNLSETPKPPQQSHTSDAGKSEASSSSLSFRTLDSDSDTNMDDYRCSDELKGIKGTQPLPIGSERMESPQGRMRKESPKVAPSSLIPQPVSMATSQTVSTNLKPSQGSRSGIVFPSSKKSKTDSEAPRKRDSAGSIESNQIQFGWDPVISSSETPGLVTSSETPSAVTPSSTITVTNSRTSVVNPTVISPPVTKLFDTVAQETPDSAAQMTATSAGAGMQYQNWPGQQTGVWGTDYQQSFLPMTWIPQGFMLVPMVPQQQQPGEQGDEASIPGGLTGAIPDLSAYTQLGLNPALMPPLLMPSAAGLGVPSSQQHQMTQQKQSPGVHATSVQTPSHHITDHDSQLTPGMKITDLPPGGATGKSASQGITMATQKSASQGITMASQKSASHGITMATQKSVDGQTGGTVGKGSPVVFPSAYGTDDTAHNTDNMAYSAKHAAYSTHKTTYSTENSREQTPDQSAGLKAPTTDQPLLQSGTATADVNQLSKSLPPASQVGPSSVPVSDSGDPVSLISQEGKSDDIPVIMHRRKKYGPKSLRDRRNTAATAPAPHNNNGQNGLPANGPQVKLSQNEATAGIKPQHTSHVDPKLFQLPNSSGNLENPLTQSPQNDYSFNQAQSVGSTHNAMLSGPPSFPPGTGWATYQPGTNAHPWTQGSMTNPSLAGSSQVKPTVPSGAQRLRRPEFGCYPKWPVRASKWADEPDVTESDGISRGKTAGPQGSGDNGSVSWLNFSNWKGSGPGAERGQQTSGPCWASRQQVMSEGRAPP